MAIVVSVPLMVRVISRSEWPETQPLMARNEMNVRPAIISWKFEIIIPIKIRLIPLVSIRAALRVHMTTPPLPNRCDPIP